MSHQIRLRFKKEETYMKPLDSVCPIQRRVHLAEVEKRLLYLWTKKFRYFNRYSKLRDRLFLVYFPQ